MQGCKDGCLIFIFPPLGATSNLKKFLLVLLGTFLGYFPGLILVVLMRVNPTKHWFDMLLGE